jgi:hypothetical protein
MHPLHGNVDTRLAKLDRGDSDALVLAVAGLTRLGRADRIDDVLPASVVASAPGQGALAIQVRSDDAEAVAAVGLLDEPDTRAAVEAERALLNGTGGGCRSPIGALGRVRDSELELVAGAERTWTPAHAAAIPVPAVVWVRGRAPTADRRVLAARLAARIVTLRQRPRVLPAAPGRPGAPQPSSPGWMPSTSGDRDPAARRGSSTAVAAVGTGTGSSTSANAARGVRSTDHRGHDAVGRSGEATARSRRQASMLSLHRDRHARTRSVGRGPVLVPGPTSRPGLAAARDRGAV